MNPSSVKTFDTTVGEAVTLGVPFTTQFVECIKWKLDEDDYVIDENQTLTYTKSNQTYNLGEYAIRNDNSTFVCVPYDQSPIVYYIDLIYLGQCILSAVSLVIAIVIESLVPSKNQDYRPLISHMVSLLVFYLSRITVYVMKDPNRQFCFFLSYCILYTIRAAFAWVTVINFEIWCNVRPAQFFRTKSKVAPWKKFFYQSLFAWSLPAIIIGVAYMLQYAKPMPDQEEACSMLLSKNELQIIFFYSATGVLLLVNVLLFILTTISLRRVGKSVPLEVNANVHEQLRRFYFKLMVITGIYWILEIPVWASAHTVSHIYSVIVDTITFLQGFILLLLIYGCRKSLGAEIKLKIREMSS